MNKIIVTGGLGYIGSHTCVALDEAGFQVVIYDNLSNSDLRILPRIQGLCQKEVKFREVDLSDPTACANVLKEEDSISGVIHFAASKAVGESVDRALHYYKNNLFSTINLLQEMKEKEIQNFIFSSSCTVYGEPDTLPVTESSPIKPAESPYGNTKQIAEEILRDTIKGKEMILKCISLRYFNPIGAHPSGRIGELPQGTPANLLPYVLQTANGKRDHLRIWGNDYPTPDGTAIRDYIHVMDLAEAHVLALRRLLQGKNEDAYEVFNLGTGKGRSVLEVLRSVEKAAGHPIPHQFYDRRPGDVTQIYADASRANEVLGWKAKYELDDMTNSAWHWEKEGLKDLS